MRRESIFVDTIVAACRAGMEVVRHYQIEGVPKAEVKENQTLLTIADTASQKAINDRLRLGDREGRLALWGEEDGVKQFIGEGLYGVLIDPLDGTNAFVAGMMTSTVILGVYDRDQKTLVCCAIGEPVSGRLWVATDMDATWAYHANQKCTTWQAGSLTKDNKNNNVFLDLSHGFKSRGNQILTDEKSIALYGRLASRARVMMPWSNGLMQALVANGNERMAGSVTTATGGPWDVCGALLVRQAGGAVRAFTRLGGFETADPCAGGFEQVDPLNVLAVDLLVCAANRQILGELCAIVGIG